MPNTHARLLHNSCPQLVERH